MTAATPTRTPAVHRREVAVEGVRFVLDRAAPSRKRSTTPAILLHGIPQTRAIWGPLVAELSRDRIVLAPDLKGLGESEMRGPYDAETLSREIAALALHEVDGRVDVVGHDWGGVIALGLAAARPDLVRRLVVINAPYRHVDVTRAFHIPLFAVPFVPEAVFAAAGDRIVNFMLDYAWRSATPLAPDARERYVAAYSDPRRVHAMLGYYRAAVGGRVGRLVQALVGRGGEEAAEARAESALVIWGAADPVMPVGIGESVVRDLGPDTEFVVLPGVGHFAVDEAPDIVTDLVASFLRAEGTRQA
jgi:pimeloyl-ACP methyl ester carboxylesterase